LRKANKEVLPMQRRILGFKLFMLSLREGL